MADEDEGKPRRLEAAGDQRKTGYAARCALDSSCLKKQAGKA